MTRPYELAGEIKKKQASKREKIRKLKEKWESEKESRELTVDENDIADVISGWTKIPVSKLAEGETERLLKLESILHERVVGGRGGGCRREGDPPRKSRLKRPGSARSVPSYS